MTRLVLLVGPTASGKSDVAMGVAALDRRVEIVCADSQQVYRGFDVGTAKPTADERANVRHHGIDVVDPDEPMDAATFVRLADEAIADVRARGGVPLVVGGTGLWMRALIGGLIDVPRSDPRVRAALEAQIAHHGSAALHARLGEVDPESAAAIASSDPVRIVRALEIFEQTGQRASSLRDAHRHRAQRYEATTIALDVPADFLATRIAARTDRMLRGGWVDEVRQLLARWPRTARPFGAVGYREVVEHVEKGVALGETRDAIVRATRGYAKRQRTWFRKDADRWVSADEAVAEIRGMI